MIIQVETCGASKEISRIVSMNELILDKSADQGPRARKNKMGHRWIRRN